MAVEFKGYTLQQERIELMHAEIRVLHDRHYRETEVKYLDRPMDPDYAGFAELERQGAFACYTVRERATGQMVGYLMFFVNRSLHMDAKVAQEDAYYVVPEHRGTGIARQLLRNAEADLKATHGVHYTFMSSKKPVGGPNIGPLLEIEGYSEIAHVYSKKL
jgi:GNAT superfamily N-acetyltransferase